MSQQLLHIEGQLRGSQDQVFEDSWKYNVHLLLDPNLLAHIAPPTLQVTIVMYRFQTCVRLMRKIVDRSIMMTYVWRSHAVEQIVVKSFTMFGRVLYKRNRRLVWHISGSGEACNQCDPETPVNLAVVLWYDHTQQNFHIRDRNHFTNKLNLGT